MHVEQGRQLARRIARQVALQGAQLGSDRVARNTQTLDFGINLGVLDEVVRHIDPTRRDQHSAPDGNAS